MILTSVIDEWGNRRTFSPDDLKKLAKTNAPTRCRQLSRCNYREVSADEAREIFQDQPYKLELIDGSGSKVIWMNMVINQTEPVVISTYKHDSFEDLCRGPHVEHTGQIPAAGIEADECCWRLLAW